MRLKKINWRRWRWFALILGMFGVMLLVFASNRCLYLSHQRFPFLTRFQWKHKPAFDVSSAMPQIIGHRGSGLESTDLDATPENSFIGNTRNAIQTAIEANVDWIEIDIRRSKDGKLVVFHDSEIDSKTTDTGAVEDSNFQDLQSVDVLVDPPEKILSLDEVFASFHSDHRRWILDIKSDEISEDVLLWLKKTGVGKDQVIIFGDYEVLKDYKTSSYRLGYTTLFGSHYRKMLFTPSKVLDRCETLHCTLVVVPIVFITPDFVGSATSRDIEVWSYGSDAPQDLKYSAACGVRGLIVDNPHAATAQFMYRGDKR
jgi:glycerophosphoryl diester phosphodiesterase